MIKRLLAALKLWQKKQNFKYAVRKANYLQNKNFKKHYVFLWDGKFVVVERQRLKDMHKRGAFKANLKTVESHALHTTSL